MISESESILQVNGGVAYARSLELDRLLLLCSFKAMYGP